MARLRPSSAHRWVPCPGSVTLCEKYPETGDPGAPALEGTAAHWVASEVLKSYESVAHNTGLSCTWDFVDKQAPNGIIITEEMVRAVQVYVKDVLTLVQDAGSLSSLRVEAPVDIPSVHSENAGTLDTAAYTLDMRDNTLTVWDFKYGWGIIEPRSNWQLLDYATGLLNELDPEWQPRHIELRVVQPRLYHPMGSVRSWRFPIKELQPFVDKMNDAAVDAFSKSPRYSPGVPQCTHCSGRAHCTALNRAVYHIQEFVDHSPPQELPGVALGARVHQLRQYSKLISALTSGVEERAMSEIRNGGDVPGWHAQRGAGTTKWKKGAEDQVGRGRTTTLY